MPESFVERNDAPVLRSALRKARWRLIPLLAVCYLVAYMDRANISFAAQTMSRDLHFTPKIYGLGAGLFFVSYALCEIPSNRLLLRFGARRWLARIMLTWGLVAMAMVLTRSPRSFYGLRLLLGVAEAGYFPGAIYFLSQWFPRRLRARVLSFFYIGFALSGTVMGSLAGTLLRLNGRWGLAGWQWIFLVEAFPAVLLSGAVWLALPDKPKDAKWLSEAESAALSEEVAADNLGDGPGAAAHAKGSFLAVLRSGRAWTVGLFYFCGLGTWYALTFSLPTILGQMTGWDAGHVGYLIAGVGLLGGLLMVTLAWSSDRTGDRRWHIVICCVLMLVGALVAGTHLSGSRGVCGVLLIALSYYAMQGPVLGVMTTILPGEGSAIAIALANMCGNAGGFVAPYFMGWMREATGDYAVGIVSLAVPCMVAIGCMLAVTRKVAAKGPAREILR
jgi:ACS family tartrate transporter-like MFS transporter